MCAAICGKLSHVGDWPGSSQLLRTTPVRTGGTGGLLFDARTWVAHGCHWRLAPILSGILDKMGGSVCGARRRVMERDEADRPRWPEMVVGGKAVRGLLPLLDA